MTQDEYLAHLINFLCEINKYNDFEEYLRLLGYSQDDIDDCDLEKDNGLKC